GRRVVEGFERGSRLAPRAGDVVVPVVLDLAPAHPNAHEPVSRVDGDEPGLKLILDRLQGIQEAGIGAEPRDGLVLLHPTLTHPAERTRFADDVLSLRTPPEIGESIRRAIRVEIDALPQEIGRAHV